jgi:small subunit ribosomal protein S16
MATKIRLQRRGRKKRAFFQIVVADSRAPRDGRYIENIGSYNPMTDPATITLNVERATEWVMTGAEPTYTAGAILRYKGVMYKKHLQVGVNKGAITQEAADQKFATWVEEKEGKIDAKKLSLADAKSTAAASAFKAETAKKEAIAAKVIAKNNPEMEAETAEEAVVAETTEEVVTETTEEVVAETTEEVVAETTEEVVAETTEEVVAEKTEEVAAEETPKVAAEETSAEAPSEEKATEK